MEDHIHSDLSDKMDAAGYVEEAEELDAITNTLGKKAAVLKWDKGYIKGTVGSGDDVFVTKENPELNLEVGDKLQIQKVNPDGTYNVKKRPFRDNPDIITVSREEVSSRNPKPWYSKRAEDMCRISKMIDKVADSLESKGYTKEAATLDTIANLVDKVASNIPGQEAALKVGLTPKVWADMLDPEKIKFNEWLSQGQNGEILKRVLIPEEAAKAVVSYDYIRGILKDNPDLKGQMDEFGKVKDQMLKDLKYVQDGLKVIPELTKWIQKESMAKMDKLMQDETFKRKVISQLSR